MSFKPLSLVVLCTLCTVLHAETVQRNTFEPKRDVPFDADLFHKNDPVFSSHTEFLYWNVNEGALDYVLEMKRPAWGPTNAYAQGTMHSAIYNWEPGFRIALSYFRAPHFWEVKGQYTRLTAQGSDRINKPDASTVYLNGTWPQIMSTPLSEATSRIHLNYNVFDLLVDRVFFPNPHLRLRVLGGGCTAWMDQDWHVRYRDANANETSINNRWKFIGGGIKAGAMVDWFWTTDIYMTGLMTTSLLMGSYSNHSIQTTNVQPDPLDDPSIPVRDVKVKNARLAYNTQMFVGPSWQKNYPCWRIEVFVGYEFQAWFNLNEIYRSTASGATAAKETWINSSVLGLQGLTTRLTVDF